jgi:NO-binding membrane sensor protein with MHYT domain
MFDNVRARYALRCILFGVSAFLVSLQASSAGSDLQRGEVIQALIAAGIAALSYAGIGVASSSVEPSIGNTRGE